MKIQKLFESRDVTVYKRLITILGDYTHSYPMTGMDKLFNALIEQGKKIMPKDKLALGILEHILIQETIGASVQNLLNERFANLIQLYKPMFKGEKGRIEVAFWTRGGIISDRVKDRVDWSGQGAKGFWSNMNGEKVELIPNESIEELKEG